MFCFFQQCPVCSQPMDHDRHLILGEGSGQDRPDGGGDVQGAGGFPQDWKGFRQRVQQAGLRLDCQGKLYNYSIP